MKNAFIILLILPVLAYSQHRKIERLPNDYIDEIGKKIGQLIGEDTIEYLLLCVEEPTNTNKDNEDWVKYLTANLVLDNASLDTIPTGTYQVSVQFVIDERGEVNNVSIIKDPGYSLGKRVADVVLAYKGYWEFSILNGSPKKLYRRQPITFIVEEENECENELPMEVML